MDILSKDTLNLLRDEKLRKAVERVLEPGTSTSETVTVQDDDSIGSKKAAGSSKQVTVRRLSA